MAQISVGGTGLVLKSAIQLAATSLSSTSNGDGAQVFGFSIGKLLLSKRALILSLFILLLIT